MRVNKTTLKFEDIEILFPTNVNTRKKGNSIKVSLFDKKADISNQNKKI